MDVSNDWYIFFFFMNSSSPASPFLNMFFRRTASSADTHYEDKEYNWCNKLVQSI